MIFCGNLEDSGEKISSLFDMRSRDLISSTSIPRVLLSPSLIFIAETLSRRCPETDWTELLRAEIEERLIQ